MYAFSLPLGSKGAWVSPDGKIHPIGTGSHEQVITRFYRDMHPDEAFARALEDGWVRVTYPLRQDDGFGFFAVHEDDLKRAIRRHLRDMRGSYRVDLEWGFDPHDLLHSKGTYKVLNSRDLSTYLGGVAEVERIRELAGLTEAQHETVSGMTPAATKPFASPKPMP